jgi:hypothetical protein
MEQQVGLGWHQFSFVKAARSLVSRRDWQIEEQALPAPSIYSRVDLDVGATAGPGGDLQTAAQQAQPLAGVGQAET